MHSLTVTFQQLHDTKNEMWIACPEDAERRGRLVEVHSAVITFQQLYDTHSVVWIACPLDVE
eukprot:9042303-Prorocentrum_lima.AAC.1